jgi:hypothetical protein
VQTKEMRVSEKYSSWSAAGAAGLGATPAVFTVTLSTPAAFTVTVDYEVSSGLGDDGAKIGEDLEAAGAMGILVFEPGSTLKNYAVFIIGDVIPEKDEFYSSLISNASVPITVNTSPASILNDDDHFIYIPAIHLTP